MFKPLSPRDLDSWADADPITTADKETISIATELREARKKIAAAERIIEYADGHPDMCCGQCGRAIHEAEERLSEADERTRRVYEERARMVGAFAALFPGGCKPSEDGDDDYYLIYLDTPEGQVSWHINKADRQWVGSYDVYQGEWDGHTTDEKYDRLLLGAAAVRTQVVTLKAALNAIWPDLGVARRRYPDDQYIEAAYINADSALRDAQC